MGMFDSFYLTLKCPNCGEESEMEIQTKELECELNVWREGDYVGTKQYNYVRGLASCESDECMEYMKKKYPNVHGFGRGFDVKVKLKDGKVTGKCKIL